MEDKKREKIDKGTTKAPRAAAIRSDDVFVPSSDGLRPSSFLFLVYGQEPLV